MTDQAPSQNPEAQKRRSTRIMQAVPLTVTGVDALGQPFQERTSTLILNCHGCKYQSKHYVLKNTIITLEIPRPGNGAEPRQVQARVTWIQRPRTTRELFQVGVELLVPGNAWGIAFPPDDWFPYPEDAEERTAPALEVPAEPPAMEEAAPTPPSKVRTMPSAVEQETVAELNRQMQKLLAEARQQIEQTVRQSASGTLASEAAKLLRELDTQLRTTADRIAEEAVTLRTEHLAEQAAAKVEELNQQSSRALEQRWQELAESGLEPAREQLLAQLTTAGEEARRKIFNRLTRDLELLQQQESESSERLTRLQDELDSSLANVQARLAALQEEINSASDSARANWAEQIAAQQREASDLRQTMGTAAGEILGTLRAKLEGETASAAAAWGVKIESSLNEFAQGLGERLAEVADSAAAAGERQAAERIRILQATLEQAAAGTLQAASQAQAGLSERIEQAQASLSAVAEAEERLQNLTARSDELQQRAGEALTARFDELLHAQKSVLDEQAEKALREMLARLQPALDTAGEASLARVASLAEDRARPELAKIDQAIERLARAEQHAEEMLRSQPDKLRKASEHYLREASDWLNTSLGELQKSFQESSRKAMARFAEELESRSTEATHTTFEALLKAADWYQKRAQTGMQTSLEKVIEQASASLRERAAEISSMFASELDHYSRSYTEHTQGLLEEAAREMVNRARGQLGQSLETSKASFDDELQLIGESKLERFSEASLARLGQVSEQLQARIGEVREKAAQEAEQTFVEFQNRMLEAVGKGVSQAQHDFESTMISVVDAWRTDREQQQAEWQQGLKHQTDEAVEGYKERLQNVSNSWMVASVTALNQHSQNLMHTLQKAAEQRLQDTCARAFTGIAEILRERLLNIAADLRSGQLPPRKENT